MIKCKHCNGIIHVEDFDFLRQICNCRKKHPVTGDLKPDPNLLFEVIKNQ
jgi:hypothetical protein